MRPWCRESPAAAGGRRSRAHASPCGGPDHDPTDPDPGGRTRRATLVCSGGPALGGGFDDETILRTPPAGTRLEASDIEAKATMSSSAGRRCRSAAAGPSPSAPAMTVARPGSRGCVLDPVSTSSARSASTCEGWAWAVSGLHTAGAPAAQWRVVLDGHQIGSPGFFQIQPAHLQRHQPRADIACVGNKRLAVAWLQKVAGVYRAKVYTRGVIFHPKETTRPSCRSTSARRPCPRGSVSPRPRTASVSPGSGATMRGTSASTSAPGRTSQ